jgi:hypothetical protein
MVLRNDQSGSESGLALANGSGCVFCGDSKGFWEFGGVFSTGLGELGAAAAAAAGGLGGLGGLADAVADNSNGSSFSRDCEF